MLNPHQAAVAAAAANTYALMTNAAAAAQAAASVTTANGFPTSAAAGTPVTATRTLLHSGGGGATLDQIEVGYAWPARVGFISCSGGNFDNLVDMQFTGAPSAFRPRFCCVAELSVVESIKKS